MLQEEYQIIGKCENIAEVAPTFKNNGHYMKLYENLK